MTTRRQLLQGLGAGLTLGGLGAAPAAAGGLGSWTCNYNVLHIFLFGAISHLDTYWVNQGPAGATPLREPPDMSEVPGAAGASDTAFATAGQYANLDHDVRIGAGLHPLVQLGAHDQMRLVAMRAPFDVHTLSSAHALTGTGVGQPGAMSLGARIQATMGATDTPASWVLDAAQIGRITAMAAATGTLGGQYRPFVLPIGSDAVIPRLERGQGLGQLHRDQIDPILDLYRNRYAGLLTHETGRVRSAAFDVYTDSVDRLIGWAPIHAALQGAPPLAQSSSSSFVNNRTTVAVRMAGHLFAQPSTRCVTIIGDRSPNLDTHTGFGDDDGTDYVGHATRHNGALWGVCEALREEIATGNIDLAETLVVISSEFGRYHDGVNGSEHRASGYASVALGGPITERGLAGRLRFDTSVHGLADAADHVTPTELLDAMSLAAGVSGGDLGVANPNALTLKVLGNDCSLSVSQ